MMKKEKYALGAARLLREQWPEGPGAQADARRDQVVASMELDVALRRRRHRGVVGAALALAAAAAIVVGLRLMSGGGDGRLVVRHAHGPKNLLVRATSTQPLAPSAVLLEGDDVSCDGEGGATLGLANGTQLTLASSSQLRVDQLGHARRFTLFHGRVDVEVTKLAANERFIVGTPDSQVEVRGTSFSVGVVESPADCGAARTRSTVKVREGAVWVRSLNASAVLGPGESWIAPCRELPTAPPATETNHAVPATEAADTAPASATGVPRPVPRRIAPAATGVTSADRRLSPPSEGNERPVSPASHLAEQNDLLSAAMAAERAGRHAVALRKLDDLMVRFPDSPLLETARIERQRIESAQPRQ